MGNNYRMNNIQKTRNTHALFFNDLDFLHIFESDKFLHPGEANVGIVPDPEDNIVYNYNSTGFRSDEFTKEHNGKHVLFAGCSETEGAGDNIENCWAGILYSHLSKNNNLSGFFNLGRSGWGWQIIIANIFEYIKKYNKPDELFIMFPNIGRFYEWIEKEGDEVYVYKGTIPNNSHPNPKAKLKKENLTVKEQRAMIVNFTLSIKMLEEYCKSNNIKLYWGTWDQDDEYNYKMIGFNNLVSFISKEEFIKDQYDFYMNDIRKRKYWERKRDGHNGYLSHYIWAQGFINRLDF